MYSREIFLETPKTNFIRNRTHFICLMVNSITFTLSIFYSPSFTALTLARGASKYKATSMLTNQSCQYYKPNIYFSYFMSSKMLYVVICRYVNIMSHKIDFPGNSFFIKIFQNFFPNFIISRNLGEYGSFINRNFYGNSQDIL